MTVRTVDRAFFGLVWAGACPPLVPHCQFGGGVHLLVCPHSLDCLPDRYPFRSENSAVNY